MSINDSRFGKQHRLLKPADFKPVFAKTLYRVSCPEFLILATPGTAPFEISRLGIVAAKKHVRNATQRNRLKRLIRESFRLGKNTKFSGVDSVVLVRSGADKLSKTECRNKLDRLWKSLHNKIKTPNQHIASGG